ncbi:MAG TPA: PIG-L family deacetylase [Chloroflexota bacterium]|nr:PIG-L family deacetylase [Chloroflexota bacterium]
MYDAIIIAPHPDDAEVQMGGTIAKLVDRGQRILLVDLTDGEPTEFAEPGVRKRQAAEAACILGVERVCLGHLDRLLQDSVVARIAVARLIREHRPRWVYGIGDACVHPDHAAAVGLTRAAVFLSRLGQWDRVPGGERLANQEPWAIERLFFPHCKMEPPWGDFAFAVDVTGVYECKRRAIEAYGSIFRPSGDRLLALYEAEDQYYGRLLGVGYAEIFRAASPLLVEDPTVFGAGIHG